MDVRPCQMRAIIADSPCKKSSCCQPAKDLQRRLLRARREIAGGADAGRAPGFARACGDEFARFLHEKRMRSKEWFGKADAARVGVEEIEVWFEEFLGVGGDCVCDAVRSEIVNRAV